MKKFLLLWVALVQPIFAAEPVKERQAIFKEYKKVVGQMGAMIKQKPYPKAAFAKMASELNALAQQPWQYFPAGSTRGKTDAKLEIWSQPNVWKQKIKAHQDETAKLQQVAQSGAWDAIKQQFSAVQQTCKSCHDTFRQH